mgnify:FL=1
MLAFVALLVASRLALAALDAFGCYAATFWPPMTEPLSDQPTDPTSALFLAANACVETFFLRMLLTMTMELPAVRLLTPVTFLLITYADDALYAMLHRRMHRNRLLYTLVHKHHHKQTRPHRGYTDAGNEHPLEQVFALGAHLVALTAVHQVVGLDAVAVWTHIGLKAVGSVVNHVNHEVVLSLGFGVVLSARYHRTHHEKGGVNFSQFVPAFG